MNDDIAALRAATTKSRLEEPQGVIKIIKLDYTLTDPQERKQLVEKIIAEAEQSETPLSPAYLESLSDYLCLCMEKQERRERKLLTENRLVTVNKHEISFEGLQSLLENGENSIYNFIAEEPNKNVLFTPKISITAEDVERIAPLAQLRSTIGVLESQQKSAVGRRAFLLKKALIEMRREQYIIKQAYQKPIAFKKLTHSATPPIPLEDTSFIDADGTIQVRGISLMDPAVCSAILCNYSRLAESSYDNFAADSHYLILDFDRVSAKALAPFPILETIVTLKIDGVSNQDIQAALPCKYSTEYISKLWRKKIPALIADAARSEFLTFCYVRDHLPMKTCPRCGISKPAHTHFFNYDKSRKDHLYSICKECRKRGRKS